MARTKKVCTHDCCETCPYDDCVKPLAEISISERIAQDRRDNMYQSYGTVPYAKRQRKDRGRRT